MKREVSKLYWLHFKVDVEDILRREAAAAEHATAISSADSQRLVAMAQTSSDDSDSETGAPEAAAYENKSGGIVDALNGVLEKAEGQLDEATKEETGAKNKFDMLKQSLTAEIKYANKDMDETKKSLAESTETKAASEGDLKVTSQHLAPTWSWQLQEVDASRRRYRPKSLKPAGSHTLRIGDIASDVSEQDLLDVFSWCGEIEMICLHINKLRNGQFGHIKFCESESVDKAVDLCGTILKGSAIRLDFAEDRPQAVWARLKSRDEVVTARRVV